MTFPKPEVGLVVSFAYLWNHEEKKGRRRELRIDLASSSQPSKKSKIESSSLFLRSRIHPQKVQTSASKCHPLEQYDKALRFEIHFVWHSLFANSE